MIVRSSDEAQGLIETSVISYLTARPSKKVIEAGHQQSTYMFWDRRGESDRIIQKVRDIRERHAASMDYDLDRIFADLKARQEKHAAEGWIVVPPPSTPLQPNLALQRVRFTRR